MLGHLARWLRLLGFDTAFAGSAATDGEVLGRARREGRVLVTRDVELASRASKAGIPFVVPPGASMDGDLAEILRRMSGRIDSERFFTRCTHCNGILVEATPADVSSLVPPRVREDHTTFQRCGSCGHIYWAGTHVEAIRSKAAELERRVNGPS